MIAAWVSQVWVQRRGWMLVRFLYQGTAFALLCGVVSRLAVLRQSPKVRHCLACAALCGMTAAPPLTLAAFAQTNPTSINREAGSAVPPTSSPAIADWQTAAGGPMAFAVASIKPSQPDARPNANFSLDDADAYVPGGRFLARLTVPTCISFACFAYKLALSREQVRSMVAGLPRWFANDLFDIEARAEGNPTKDQMRLMMQSLLADRFRLKLHFETQQVALYTLMPVKAGTLGPKLVSDEKGTPCDEPADPDSFPARCNEAELEKTSTGVRFGIRNATMSDIVHAFSTSFDRPVVDRTELGGRYDFTLEWVPDPPRSPVPPDAGAQSEPRRGPTFQEAFHDQLGLKLESSKGPIQIPVIDHIERP